MQATAAPVVKEPSAGLEPDARRMPSDVAGSFGCGRVRAQRRTRTGDPLLTMEVLYQLS